MVEGRDGLIPAAEDDTGVEVVPEAFHVEKR
jgi:hypothetical protein